MILLRYGTTIQSVEPNFDSKAFTEIGVRRDRGYSSLASDFLDGHERVSEHLLEAEAEGDVQDEVESAMLAQLLDQLEKIDGDLGEGEFVLIENEKGEDYPRTRTRMKDVVVDGDNRFHFYSSVSSPLKVGVFKAS